MIYRLRKKLFVCEIKNILNKTDDGNYCEISKLLVLNGIQFYEPN